MDMVLRKTSLCPSHRISNTAHRIFNRAIVDVTEISNRAIVDVTGKGKKNPKAFFCSTYCLCLH